MKARVLAVSLFFLVVPNLPAAAASPAEDLARALRGTPGVEKVALLEGKAAVHEKVEYSHVVVVTVTRAYGRIPIGEALDAFHSKIVTTATDRLKPGKGLLVLRDSRGRTLRTVSF